MNINDYQKGMEEEKLRKQLIREAKKDGDFLIAVVIGVPLLIIVIWVIINIIIHVR